MAAGSAAHRRFCRSKIDAAPAVPPPGGEGERLEPRRLPPGLGVVAEEEGDRLAVGHERQDGDGGIGGERRQDLVGAGGGLRGGAARVRRHHRNSGRHRLEHRRRLVLAGRRDDEAVEVAVLDEEG